MSTLCPNMQAVRRILTKEAMFWKTERDRSVRCGLCHHRCLIGDGKQGICGARENRDGKLYSLVYGNPVSIAVDPIEKKPLFHFLPGSQSLSIATRGCNFRCLHCQNCDISQVRAEPPTGSEDVPPQEIVRLAQEKGCASVSYTYTEPTIFFEYAYDIARLASQKGLKNIFVTNGYITPEALREIKPFLNAANIDLKFFDDDMYRQICGARLAPVLDMIKLYHDLGIWVEITTLVIPTYNDSDEHLRKIAEFIVQTDPFMPWHVSAFYPAHKMLHVAPTPPATLQRARKIGFQAGLKHVYTDNVLDEDGAATICPECNAAIIQRSRLTRQTLNGLVHGACPYCKTGIHGVWE